MKIITGKNKKGALGEGVIMLYRFAIIIFIALVIFGFAAVFYGYEINVRATEAAIFTKKIADCLAPVGAADLKAIEAQKTSLFDYCKLRESSRYYANISIYDESRNFMSLEMGNSALPWVNEMFEEGKVGESIRKYEPGKYAGIYEVLVLKDSEKLTGKIKINSYVSHELEETS